MNIRVTCAVFSKNKRVLLCQRSEKMSLPLKWEFPGGKIKDGETEVACIKREIKEELDVNISVIKKLTSTFHEYKELKIELIPFLVTKEAGSICLLEHKDSTWIDRNEISNFDIAKADLPIISELLKLSII